MRDVQRRRPALGEAEREHEVPVLAATGQAGVGLLDDVAGPQRVVGVLQELVCVALVARARARERGAGDERAGDPAIVGQQRVPARPADVVGAVVVELRVVGDLDVVVLLVERVEADLDQDRRALGIGHVGARQPPLLRARGLRVGQLVLGDLARRHAVSVDHELQRPRRRVREVRVVDLGQLRLAQREPDPARLGRRGPEALLVRARPVGAPARSPGRPLTRVRGRGKSSAHRSTDPSTRNMGESVPA